MTRSTRRALAAWWARHVVADAETSARLDAAERRLLYPHRFTHHQEDAMTSLQQDLETRFPTDALVEFVGEPEPPFMPGPTVERGARGIVQRVSVDMYDDGDGESGPRPCVDCAVIVRFLTGTAYCDPDELRVIAHADGTEVAA